MRVGSTLRGTLMVAGAATLWGLNGTASRLVLDAGIDPLRLTQARIAGAAAVLLLWLLLREPASLRLRGREWVAYPLFGIIGLVGVQWFYFEAIARIPIGIALIIEYIAPLLVALWVRIVWGRHLPLLAWLALPAALVGLALALGLGTTGIAALAPLGVAAALIAALAYAYYSLHAERLSIGRSAPAVLGLGLLWGTLALAIALPWWRFPLPALAAVPPDAPLGLPAFAFLVFVVVFGTLIPFVLLIAGIRRIGADGASVTAMLEPIVAGAVAWVVLGQLLAPLQVVGAAIVLVAVTAAQVARARTETTPTV
jgi:drug/metabolite transporter (DMT)-like permease